MESEILNLFLSSFQALVPDLKVFGITANALQSDVEVIKNGARRDFLFSLLLMQRFFSLGGPL